MKMEIVDDAGPRRPHHVIVAVAEGDCCVSDEFGDSDLVFGKAVSGA